VDAVKNWIESTFHIEIFNKEVYAFTTLPSEVNSWLDAKVLAVTVLFSVLICLVPAWRAARLDPVDALRHE
jgi:lipoprotein-releasing system permease protein